MTFETYGDLTRMIRDMVAAALATEGWNVETGYSNQSVSAYVEASKGDRDFKLRISDHADRYGSDFTIRIDQNHDIREETVTETRVIIEDDMEFIDEIETDVIVAPQWAVAAMVERGLSMVRSA